MGTRGIEPLGVSVYTIPTEKPESDGTLEWDSTTIVVVEATAGRARGLGYTHGGPEVATLLRTALADVVEGRDPMDVTGAWEAMRAALRNRGRPGVGALAISAVDQALWDLKARILGVSLAALLGRARERIEVYGSGGFTSDGIGRLREQLAGWVAGGIRRVKMKVGRRPADDVARVAAARSAIGSEAGLFVDANGAYDWRQALAMAERFAAYEVEWFEEPVSSDDLDGLRFVRERVPVGMEVAAGEYVFDAFGARALLDAGAVDVLMPDATRCEGVTGFLRIAALCDAWSVPMSAHTAPSLHAHLGCAVPALRHIELFFDHVRIERMLFDGFSEPRDGALAPDLSRPGLGLELKRTDAERFAA